MNLLKVNLPMYHQYTMAPPQTYALEGFSIIKDISVSWNEPTEG